MNLSVRSFWKQSLQFGFSKNIYRI